MLGGWLVGEVVFLRIKYYVLYTSYTSFVQMSCKMFVGVGKVLFFFPVIFFKKGYSRNGWFGKGEVVLKDGDLRYL